jgi:phage baseplate assembly protein W
VILKRQQFRIPVLDTKKNTAIGFRYPFGSKPLFKLNYTTQDQVKTNLICYMLTNRGERPFNPEFGANIRALLFEGMNSMEEMRETILDKITTNFPQIVVKDLIFDQRRDENTLYITLIYYYNNQEDNLTIQL